MTYKHRDIVIAWMDGKTIQHKLRDGKWVNIPHFNPILATNYAMLDENVEYRIKPEPIMVRHYVYKHALTGHPCVSMKNWDDHSNNVAADLERNDNVIWLDNWHEATFSKP